MQRILKILTVESRDRSGDVDDYVSDQEYDTYYDLIYVSLDLSVLLMDVYLLARALRVFGDGTYSEHSVLYVGNYHAVNYRHLLHGMGARQLFFSDSMDGSSCVDITGLVKKYLPSLLTHTPAN